MAVNPGLTPTQIARDVGVNPSTLTRQMREDWTSQPRIETLRKISTRYRMPIPAILLGVTEGSGFAEPDAMPITPQADEASNWQPNQSDWKITSPVLAAMGLMVGDMVRFDAAITPVSGDIVIAQHYKPRHTNAETIMRLLLPPYLLAAEIGRPQIEPILYNPDSDTVVIMGTMIKRWSIRKSPH